jgi:uncharacterized protein (DUF1697 family)
MKYAALLRGINVGGRNIVHMADLKAIMEQIGFSNVHTYIQTGNVTFEYAKHNPEKLTHHIEAMLAQRYSFPIKVHVRTRDQLKATLEQVPARWHTDADIRKYIAYVSSAVIPQEAVAEIEVQEGVDVVAAGPGAIYMSTTMEGLTKSKLNKILGKKIYAEMTMRNFVTSKRLLELLDAE